MGEKHQKNDKAEQKLDKHSEGKPGLTLERVEAVKEDAKKMFGHLMKSAEKGESKDKATEKKENYSERNPVLKPEDTATKVSQAIRDYEKAGNKVYTDAKWADKHQGNVFIANYLFCEEGNPVNALREHPIRSGTEIDLYKKICSYAKYHDITDPKEKISPDMIMKWSLEVNTNNDRQVVIEDALLTAHNVMRAIARSNAANPENLPAGDPVRQILEDCRFGERNGKHDAQKLGAHVPGLREIMENKYQQHDRMANHDQALFDANNKYAVFKPLTDYADSSTGSSYHFWVGAFGASVLSAEATRASIKIEGSHVKGNDRNGRDEQPWGNAGVDALSNVRSELHWWSWI